MIITVDRELFLKLLVQHDQGRYYTPEAGKCLYDILSELDDEGVDYVLDLDEVCEFYKEYPNATEAAMALGYQPASAEVTEDDCQFWLDLHYMAWPHPAGLIVCNSADHRSY